ncbi:MAG: hypothetical protein AAFR58_19905, partial [Cyanobacteria bacterium J06627_28]
LVVMLGVFVAVSVLEALGIGLIGPFLSIVSEPSIVREKATNTPSMTTRRLRLPDKTYKTLDKYCPMG